MGLFLFGQSHALASVYIDVRQRRIPNWLTFPGTLVGLSLNWWLGGYDGLLASFFGTEHRFFSAFFFYLLGGMGGGDVKLLAVGSFLGPSLGLLRVCLDGFVRWNPRLGSLIARELSDKRPVNLKSLSRVGFLRTGQSANQVHLQNPSLIKLPLRIEWIAFGAVVAVYFQSLPGIILQGGTIQFICSGIVIFQKEPSMNRARILIVLLVAVVVGGALSYAVYNFLQSRPVTVVRTPEKNVVVAVGTLPLGTLLKDEHLKFVSWPATNLPPGYFERKEDLLARGLVQPVVENEPILESKLAPKGSGAGLPPVIPKGMRALSIRANEIIGVAGYVGVGTRVDVVLSASPIGAQEALTKIVLQNVEVASAGQVIQKDPEGKPQTVTVVTLFVTPEDTEKLTTASSQGQFQFALRNPSGS